MNSQASSVAHRLVRLEQYLAQDPSNPTLLAEACETALAAGKYDRALEHVDTAERLQLNPSTWTHRRASVYIAQRKLDRADTLLRELQTATDHPAISHDLGYVNLLRGDFVTARAHVQPWLSDPSVAPEQLEALQVLWLRATHRLYLFDEAIKWLHQQEGQERLQPRALGPASLIAVDGSRFDLALPWSETALASDPSQIEALVARAYIALAQHQPPQAVQFLERALKSNPEDGRTWSALGYASLQLSNLPLAQTQLERAVLAVPEHVGTWHALGWTRLLQRSVIGAREAFQEALELDRNFAESHGAMGLVLAVSGEKAQAEHHLDLAQKLDPSNVTGRYARAVMSNQVQDLSGLADLAGRLLDRPGFFSGKLSDELKKAVHHQ